MATFYTNSNNQRDGNPMIYIPGSYPDASILPGNMLMYMNPPTYSDSLGGIPSVEGPDSNHQNQEILSNLSGPQAVEHVPLWRDGRNEMLLVSSIGGPSVMLHSGQNLPAQGLSLSLGTQIPSAIHMPPIPYRNLGSGFSSFLSSNASTLGEGIRGGVSRDEQSRNSEYLPSSLAANNQDSSKEEMAAFGMTTVARGISNSKYLKAAQLLLEEVVNVNKALRQPHEKNQSTLEQATKESNSESKDDPLNPNESSKNFVGDLSHQERQDLQNKLNKLLSMIDEVDRRYKQYYHQMQILVSSFDVIAGSGSAKPYTALALQTISSHFRCLRDAIAGQIQATRRLLGDPDALENSKGVGIPRLRFVDQQLRQQRAIQQLGMVQQHAWRPQRGLPETSVSILRAWLFEHFLHPYPKDSDKIMLARQTGLTRSQVSNWFINARVRLWKPMVEEMYKEEMGDADMDSNSSSDNLMKSAKGNSEDREEMQQSGSSTATDRFSVAHMMNARSEQFPDIDIAGSSLRSNFQNMSREDAMSRYGLHKVRVEQKAASDECNLLPETMVHPDRGNDKFMETAYVSRFGRGSGVSLTLGLQHCEGASMTLSGAPSTSFIPMRGDDIYGEAGGSSAGSGSSEFECINPANRRQNRFSSSHLLHDFVA